MSNRKATPPPTKSNRGLLIAVLAVAVLAVLGFGAALLNQPASPAATTAAFPTEISVSQAAEMRDAGAFILDVREPEEWNAIHIPGATLIPLGQLSQRLNEVPQDQDVVVVCRSGNRSAAARDLLRDAGFSTVTSMAGGMNDWAAQGLPTETGP